MSKGASKLDGLFGPEDPTKLFELLEELAVGSYGTVYKVRAMWWQSQFLPPAAV